MGYIYNKKTNVFEFTSTVRLSTLTSYNIASNKTSKMLTIDENNNISLTDDARNLKIKFTGTGTGNTVNDIKNDTEYTLSDFMKIVCSLFNNRYTKSEVNNLVSSGTTGLDWKQSVNSYSDIETNYPNPEDGWTVNVKDTDITYRYDGSKWIEISANAIPIATSSVDGKMSASDKTKLDGIATGANKYTHPSYTARSSGLYKITVDATGHVSGVTEVTKTDITALGIPGEGKVYNNFTGATTSTDGVSGLVPAPSKGDATRYLRSDGTWVVPPNTTYNVATSSSNGLMSSEDKSKLDGIASGATRITVDSSMSSTSTNPVQNKIINSALSNKANSTHTHKKADITDFSHTHATLDITNLSEASVKYATSAGTANGVAWGNVTGKPSLPTNISNGNGEASLIQSKGTSATGIASKSLGIGTKATGYAQTVIGKYNVESGSTSSNSLNDLAFIIGGGTSDSARANAFSVTWKGVTNVNGCYGSSGADYAEYFEWLDGNKAYEDRVGRFVTLKGDKIIYATFADDFILGVTSGNPSIIGDFNETEWQGKYKKDMFGRKITRHILDEDGNEVEEFVLSDNYNLNQTYIPRSERPEWETVGMLGKLIVYDDGTCIENEYCTAGNAGIATDAKKYSDICVTKYRVLKRLSDNIILILFR